MRCLPVCALAPVLSFVLALATFAQSAPPASQPAAASRPAAPAAVSVGLQHALDGLQTALGALDPSHLKLAQTDKQAIADSQASIARNLNDAAPGLMSAFTAQPDNLGAAFRLYRDVQAVLVVAERTHDALPPDQAADLGAANQALRGELDQLGDWIESRASAQYAQLQAKPAQAKPQPSGPPPTLVIGDANAPASTAKPAAKPKKPVPPTIPH